MKSWTVHIKISNGKVTQFSLKNLPVQIDNTKRNRNTSSSIIDRILEMSELVFDTIAVKEHSNERVIPSD